MSGLPALKRGTRQFMVLQAFFDDSYGPNAEKDPCFVLAGFISTHSNWAVFGDEWKAELGRDPALEYFKMNEAVRSKGGQWKGLGDIERKTRLTAFVQIIQKNALVRVDSSTKRSDYERFIRGKIPQELDNPYVLSFLQVITSIAKFQKSKKWNEPIDFVFDQQQQFSKEMERWWGLVRSFVAQVFGNDIVSGISFKDDKEFLPLQAADLYAWLIRNNRSQNKTIYVSEGFELAMFNTMPRIEGDSAGMAKWVKKYPFNSQSSSHPSGDSGS